MLPTTQSGSWRQGFGFPARTWSTSTDDYELYEEGDEFVLTIDMPGFELDEIGVSWHEGRLFISAEHTDETRGRQQTFHRTFRMPKEIEPDDVRARYRNGVLEVRLPIIEGVTTGYEIEVEG